MDKFFYSSPRDNDVYNLLEWIVMRDQPITEIDNVLTRSLFNVQPVSSKSMRKYILSLVPLVEKRIKGILPEKFGIMFDGWTDSSVHYVALFATFVCDGSYNEVLLSCSPLLNESDLSADEHIKYMEETLSLYGKKLSNIVCFIDDNCSVNKHLSDIT